MARSREREALSALDLDEIRNEQRARYQAAGANRDELALEAAVNSRVCLETIVTVYDPRIRKIEKRQAQLRAALTTLAVSVPILLTAFGIIIQGS